MAWELARSGWNKRVGINSDRGEWPLKVGLKGPSKLESDDGDSPESRAKLQRCGPLAGSVVFLQGPGQLDVSEA
jgi:hypothetical protein